MLPVPCQVMVQPPVCISILSAPAPVTSTLAVGDMGKVELLFFNNTRDLRAAFRATSRCGWLPTSASNGSARTEGMGASNKPAANFAVKMRRTASSIRSGVMSPRFTCSMVLNSSGFQSSGAIIMSMPALID